MRKLLLFLPMFLFAQEIRYAYSNYHAMMPVEKSFSIVAEYQKLNDTLDVFNIKSQELGATAKKFASIGDMDGGKISLSYGINKNFALFLSPQLQDIQYGSGTLKNFNIDGFVRYNIFDNDLQNSAISIDLGFSYNKAEDMSYTQIDLLNSLAQKISNRFKLIASKGQYYIIEPSTGNYVRLTQRPELTLQNLKDYSFNLRALAEKKIDTFFYLSGFMEFRYTKIFSTITANSEIVNKANQYGYPLPINLDRDEKQLRLGFNISYGKSIITECTYYYTRLFRDSGLGYINYNHVLDLNFIKPITHNLFGYIGGKLMYRQFNGEIPYLYNKYSQTTFDHKYGYAKIGVGYVF